MSSAGQAASATLCSVLGSLPPWVVMSERHPWESVQTTGDADGPEKARTGPKGGSRGLLTGSGLPHLCCLEAGPGVGRMGHRTFSWNPGPTGTGEDSHPSQL